MKHILAVTLGSAIVLGASLVPSPKLPTPLGEPILVPPPPSRVLHEYMIASEAERVGLDTLLAIAISRHENPASDPKVWSYNDCCVGLMQINVYYWDRRFLEDCGERSLYDPRTNACYGVRIFLWHLGEESGDTLRALEAYSGFARHYVRRVLARREELETLDQS